jgi:predicted dehydrogenase
MSGAQTGNLRMGVMGCSRFAIRSMIPAIVGTPGMALAAVASRTAGRAAETAEQFECSPVDGYAALLARDDVDAVYVPLPTGLHEEWVTRALEAGKHVFAEKTFAMDAASAKRMTAAAERNGVLLVENFLFPNHSQTAWVQRVLDDGAIGRPLSYRFTFSFPHIDPGDIRYDRELGGGALLDIGCYTLRAVRLFLGEEAELLGSRVVEDPAYGVDVRGAALFADAHGRTAHASWAFGMQYVCEWDIVGTEGRLTLDRAFTAPPGHVPRPRIRRDREVETVELPSDDYFARLLDAVREGGRA